MTLRTATLALFCALLGPGIAGAHALPPGAAQKKSGAMTLDVSLDRGELGPDWQKAVGFTGYAERFEFRWRLSGPRLRSVVYTVSDAGGKALRSGTIATNGNTEGTFAITLSSLPKRSKYIVRVDAAGVTPSNAVTLTKAKAKPLAFEFAEQKLEDIRAKYGVPGLTVGVSCRPGKFTEWVAGKRRHGNSAVVRTGDRWHIGSNTKAMTATMIAKLVEEGVVTWETSIWDLVHGPHDLFPEIASTHGFMKIHPRFKKVTLEHLASHRSGIRMTSGENAMTRSKAAYKKDPTKYRWQVVKRLLTRHQTGKIGEWRYGHGNYMLLGVIIERLRGKPYEQVMKDELFTPAGMTTAAFGMPIDVAKSSTDQPNGHRGGPTVSNVALPPPWNPAGGLYMSAADSLRFMRLHIDGKAGALELKRSTLNRLHQIYTKPDRKPGPWEEARSKIGDPNYGYGWGQGSSEKYGRILAHDGTYFRFYSTARVYLDWQFAVTATANLEGGDDWPGDEAAAAARNWAVKEAKKFCKPKAPFKPKFKKKRPVGPTNYDIKFTACGGRSRCRRPRR